MKKKIALHINNFAEWTVIIILLVVCCFLTITSLFYHFEEHTSTIIKDNPLISLFAVFLFLAIIGLLSRLLLSVYRRFPYLDKVLLVITLFWVCGFSYVFVIGAKTLPCSDAKSVYDIAVRMYNGDMGAVVPTGSYLSLWPFQTGMIFIFEKLMRIFNTTDSMMLQYWNIFYIGLAVLSGYGFIQMITNRLEAILSYFLLAGTFFPVFLYATSIYGDVPALSLMMFSCWMFLASKRATSLFQKIVFWAFTMGGAVLACTYRRNCLIYVIALVIVCSVKLIQFIDWSIILPITLTVILSFSSTTITQKYYEYYAKNECGPGVPAIAYIAMGMQEGVAAPGFWNGYHANLYMETGYDYEETAETSKASIRDSLSRFKEDPLYMIDFYYKKLLCQWTEPTFASFAGVDELYEPDRSSFALDILYGKCHYYLVDSMNIHQSIVYVLSLFAFIYLLIVKKSKQHLELYHYVLAITIIGGFLFTMIWEGGSRYPLPYLFFLIPYASMVVPSIMDKLTKKRMEK